MVSWTKVFLEWKNRNRRFGLNLSRWEISCLGLGQFVGTSEREYWFFPSKFLFFRDLRDSVEKYLGSVPFLGCHSFFLSGLLAVQLHLSVTASGCQSQPSCSMTATDLHGYPCFWVYFLTSTQLTFCSLCLWSGYLFCAFLQISPS